jgi:hypothetical protein
MIWIQSEYDKSQGLERYFLQPDDWEDTWQDPETGKVFDCAYEAEWYATVTHGANAFGTGDWLALMEPADEERFRPFSEYFLTREEAQRWAELEIQPERLKLRLVEQALDRA